MDADSALPVPPRPDERVSGHRRWSIPAVCLLATFIVTTYFGGWHYVGFVADLGQPSPDVSHTDLAFWLGGLWFSVSVLTILGAHEAGHYLACRHYGVEASLPIFLPAPLPLTGTFGAFIRIRDVIPHKQALFDIGVAGPFAGFVVAVPALVLGLWLSRLVSMPEHVALIALGRPLIFQLAEHALWGALPADQLLHLHPVALAAWFGLLATALNLFPMAQLDGGHLAYAVFGAKARWITLATAAVILALTLVSASWIAWAILVVGVLVVAGPSHPATLNDAAPLGGRRTALAVAAAVVFLLCFTATPVELIEGLGYVNDAVP